MERQNEQRNENQKEQKAHTNNKIKCSPIYQKVKKRKLGLPIFLFVYNSSLNE